MLTKGPRGTKDVLPEEVRIWVHLENEFRKVCANFGYEEIRTPTFEHTELFQRGVGETTDIVEKEMYTFIDKGGRSITLKPEGTAPVVRAYLEHNLYSKPQPVKLFYITPGFRYERPQAGRLREFHQFGIEVFGADSPAIDAEVISLAMFFLEELGLKNLELTLNSIGCPTCRQQYRDKIQLFFKNKIEELCETCKSRLDRNPMRILDCKNKNCKSALQGAPKMLDNLCEECKEHFELVQERLKDIGYSFEINPNIVRGLDYYTKTVFEIISNELGAQNTICGGGRYDGLIKECGGPSMPGIGFGMGIERLILTLESQGIDIQLSNPFDVFIATIGADAEREAFKILYKLRKSGISADMDYLGRSIKSQMKYSNKYNAKYTLILGEDELKQGLITVKNMATGNQEKKGVGELIEYIKGNLEKQKS